MSKYGQRKRCVIGVRKALCFVRAFGFVRYCLCGKVDGTLVLASNILRIRYVVGNEQKFRTPPPSLKNILIF